MDLIAQLARELNLKADNIEAAVKLIDEGNTIPFISRYRKEATGGMDDVALRALDERLSYLRNLEQRKEDMSCAARYLPMQAKSGMITISRNILPDTRQIG